MTFEEYLISKKIDSKAFREEEDDLWTLWQREFEQMHPNSFTAQKLYLINPVRLKYPLKKESLQGGAVKQDSSASTPKESLPNPVVKAAKPIFKPKPKIN